jgi:membrane-associated protein
MFGYLIGFIPWVSSLVTKYIDVILLLAVGGTALVTGWHYLSERRKARKAAEAGEDVETDAAEAEALVLEADMFERRHEHHHTMGRHVKADRDDGTDAAPPA